MSNDSTPRRGIAFDDSVDPIEDISSAPASSKQPSRARRKFGKGALAAALASTVAAGALFAVALTARDGSEPALESVDASKAVPVEAQQATQLGFANRAADVSRNMVRDGVSSVATDEKAKDRASELTLSADEALEAQAGHSAEERIRLMEEDLKKADQQAAQLKKEAEEAARKLEEARKAAEAAKQQAAGQTEAAGQSQAAAPEAKASTSTLSETDVANLSSSGVSMPIKENYRVGANFGRTGVWSRYHTGQDFPAPTGTPVYAVASGVTLSPTNGSWAGNNVIIQHDSGAVLYAHLSRTAVSPGQTVKPGQVVGYVGNTGNSFGSHLHFEYYPNGTTPGKIYSAADPMAFLKRIGAAG